MDPGSLHHIMQVAGPYLPRYGYPAVFFGVMLGDFGVPLPGETLLIAGAFAASRGDLNIVFLLLLGWSGAIIGDNIGYAIGRFGGRQLVLRYGRYVRITDERLGKVESFFDRFGGPVVIVARFIELLRQLHGIAAGIGRMSWPRFLLYNAIGAALWVGAWGLLAYFFGSHVAAVLGFLEGHRLWIYVSAGIVVLGVAAWLLWRRYARHAEA